MIRDHTRCIDTPITSPRPPPAVACQAGVGYGSSELRSEPANTSATGAVPSKLRTDEINQLKNMPKNLLNLNFNEESWVEIYSADPSDYFQVVYKLFYENETYQLQVESPLVVVVGNASGVVGTFNDLPLDFSANANRLDVSVIRLSNG